MEKTCLLIFSLVFLSQLPEYQSYCSQVSSEWHKCQNIQDAEQIESTIQYFTQSGSSLKKLSIENCNMSIISTTLFSQGNFNQITDLNITNSQVEFIELGSFDKLESLQNLNISGNNIEELNGKFLEKLSNFRRLTLKKNQIKRITNICSAKNLKEIFIEDSKFTSLINENTFIGCYNLERLSIINSGINSLRTNITLHFPRLTFLNLSGNHFEDLVSFQSNNINYLDISNNKITKLDAEIFRNIFPNLDEINLNNNLIKYLVFSGEEPFENNRLRKIFLNNNQLAIINNVFFKYFSYLQILDIDNNPLENIASLSFNNLIRLQKLFIKNSLKKIPHLNVGLFNGLISLKELDLSSASIISIENFVFKDLKSLNKLNLEDNKINEINNGTFAGLTLLKEINLSNNNISSIEAGAFFGLHNIDKISPKSFATKLEHLKTRHFEGLSYYYISELDLSFLGIRTLEAQTFKGLFGLRIIHLQGNILEELVANVFDGIEYLTTLNISSTNLSKIHKNAFNGLTSLKELDLSNSRIVQLSPNTFDQLFGLYLLDLSNNRLETIEPWIFRKLHSLQLLYLHDNVVTKLPANCFTGLSAIRNLTFSSKYLRVQDIEAGAFIGLQSITSNLKDFFSKIAILKTDTFADNLNLRNIDFSNYRIQVIEPFAFRGLKFIDLLNLENNNISVLHKNAFSSPVTIETLSLKKNRLNGISSDPFIDSNITKLILDDNNLETLDFGTISQIPYLQILHINNASVKKLIRSSENMTHLKELYLRDNSIDSLNVWMFYGMNNLTKLDLSRNPIIKIEFAAFEQLHNLEYLYLSQINIDDLSLATLSGLKALQYLSITNSSIKYLRNYCFTNTELSYLIFIDTIIESISPNAFGSIEHLKELTISNGNVTHLDYFDISSLGTLKSLKLDRNNISTIECNRLKYLNQLDTLILDNSHISKIEVCAFTNLSKLTTLDLSFNNLRYFTPGTFSPLENLARLNISYNSVKELHQFVLYPLKRIQYLDFNFNRLRQSSAFEVIEASFSMYVGLNGNQLDCVNLMKTLEYFKGKNIRLLDYNLTYDNININGIECT